MQLDLSRFDGDLNDAMVYAGAVWTFTTANFGIGFFPEDEDMDPADSFSEERDIEFAREDNPAHWFCAVVRVFDKEGKCIGSDALGGCSYNSFREFYSSHRWEYSRKQKRFIEDPKSRAWKACRAYHRKKGYTNGDYFTDMVAEAIKEARQYI